jgi:hypothetical protein
MANILTTRGIIAEILSEDVAFDTCAEAADLMLSKLAAAGLKVVPIEPTKAIKSAWRLMQKEGQAIGPVKTWQAMLAAIDE